MPVLTEHRFSVRDYYRMAENGVLAPGVRVELLDGRIIDMAPIGSFHGGSTNRLNRIFNRLAKGRWLVAAQNPLQLDEHSEPQPDIMLLKLRADDYTTRHPAPDDVFLLVEISDTTLDYDREDKLPAYARAGVREAWILNLVEHVLEVYREPQFDGYASKVVLHAGDQASPQAFPDAVVDVAELVK